MVAFWVSSGGSAASQHVTGSTPWPETANVLRSKSIKACQMHDAS